MRLLKPANGLIGVDITSSAVKLVELKHVNSTYQIESYAMQPLSDGAVVERRMRDSNSVVSALRLAVDQAKPRTRKAVVAVPASAAFTKTLSFPASLGDDEIEALIVGESDRHIPFPFSEVAFDFQPLGPAFVDKGLQQVLLVACRQHDIIQLTETLEHAGLEPTAVDVEAFAIERSLAEWRRQLSVDSDPDVCVGLIDIGTTMSAFHVVRGGRIIYSHDTIFGGRQLTTAIRDYYSISMEDADAAKKLGGLPDDYHAKVLIPFLDAVRQQVSRALQFYYASSRHQEVQHIVLTGGSGVIPGLAERITGDSGMPVTIANPFHRMQVNKRLNVEALTSNAPAMLTAAGLAMKGGQ